MDYIVRSGWIVWNGLDWQKVNGCKGLDWQNKGLIFFVCLPLIVLIIDNCILPFLILMGDFKSCSTHSLF